MFFNILVLAGAGAFLRVLLSAAFGFNLPGGIALLGLMIVILSRLDGPGIVPVSFALGFLLPDLLGG
jgi:hypothetical protein